MRTDNTNSLDIWHYADIYANKPVLADAWIQDNSNTNLDRTLITSTLHNIKLNVLFEQTATRPMPTHSIPGYIDHF